MIIFVNPGSNPILILALSTFMIVKLVKVENHILVLPFFETILKRSEV